MSRAQRRQRRGRSEQQRQQQRQEPGAAAVPLRHEGTTSTRVLLVIAHPDDESMFFTPAIADLQRRGCELFLLCCSTGACMCSAQCRGRE